MATANKYFNGIQLNDGKGDYPFTDDCYRLENGMNTSGPSPITAVKPPAGFGGLNETIPGWADMGCKKQFEQG